MSAVSTCCHASHTRPSFNGHTSELVTEESAWTVTGGTLWIYSPEMTALAWCSVGSRHITGTTLLLRHLEEGAMVLGSRSSLTPNHPLPASKDSVWFILRASWMPADHSVVWGLMLPITSLEFQTTGRNREIPVSLWFGVLMVSQRRGADAIMWVERHRQGITWQLALQQAIRCALEG